MTAAKLQRILDELRARLEGEPSFTDGFTGQVEFSVKTGGLAGDVIITKRLQPQK
jgi:hypothetical protein